MATACDTFWKRSCKLENIRFEQSETKSQYTSGKDSGHFRVTVDWFFMKFKFFVNKNKNNT